MELWDLVSFSTGLTVYVGYLLSQCRFEVQEGHLAVTTRFGKADFSNETVKELKTYKPGLHFKWPWQKVQEISLMEQMIELSGEEGGTRAMASDGTMLRLDSTLRYTPVEKNLYNLLFSIEKPLEHVKGIFICLLRNEIANFDQVGSKESDIHSDAPLLNAQVGSYAALRRERKLLNSRIQNFCRSQIGDRYGIRFDGVDLTDILPPNELANALNSVINAQSEAQRLYAQTESECEQRVQAAKKGLAIARAKSNATEEEIATIGEILADLQDNGTLQHYVKRRRAEVFAESRTSFVRIGL